MTSRNPSKTALAANSRRRLTSWPYLAASLALSITCCTQPESADTSNGLPGDTSELDPQTPMSGPSPNSDGTPADGGVHQAPASSSSSPINSMPEGGAGSPAGTGGSGINSGISGSGPGGSNGGTTPNATPDDSTSPVGAAGSPAGGAGPNGGGPSDTPSGGNSAAAGGSAVGGEGPGPAPATELTGPLGISCPFDPSDFAGLGEEILFNDDGAWNSYTDERAVVDAAGGKILVSSDANDGERSGNVDAVIYDIESGEMERTVLGTLAPDEHNSGALLVKAPGEYLAFWAGHNESCDSYYRNYADGAWSAAQNYEWSGCPWLNNSVTYNNLYPMAAEGKLYNFVRSVDESPNLLVSEDGGQSFEYTGRLTSVRLGFGGGYYRYWGNGEDRVDFFATENHPREVDTSLYHGYVRGGKTYDTFDQELDDNVADGEAPLLDDFPPVFRNADSIEPVGVLSRLWNIDLMRYPDGTITALWKAREGAFTQDPNGDATHHMFYSRFLGAEWKHTYLGDAGPKLSENEADSVGLAALHPDDPRVVFMSTPVDPGSGTATSKRELYMGVTCDDGTSFEWVALTVGSEQDNIRPIVPQWDANNMVLLWLRGTHETAQSYSMQVVGNVVRKAP